MRFREHPLRYGLLLLCLLFTLAWGAWHLLRPPTPPAVLTSPVTLGDLEDLVLATGVIQPLRQIDVGAQVSGQLKRLTVTYGDKVKKGQVLGEIDPELIQNDLKAAEARLDQQLAQRDSKLALLSQSRQELAREARMAQDQSGSARDLLAAQTRYRQNQADMIALQAQIRQQQFEVDKQRTNLGYTKILAPMDGVVVDIVTKQGQTVNAAQQVPVILKLADLSSMTVKTQVAEADTLRIKPGMPVYFSILGASDQRFDGKLRIILPTPEKINNAMFYNAPFDVPNPDGKLRVDMTAEVSIVLHQVKQVLSVPLEALDKPAADGRYTVRVRAADGQLAERMVTVGVKTATRAQVLQGLKVGETVVIGDAAEDKDKDKDKEGA